MKKFKIVTGVIIEDDPEKAFELDDVAIYYSKKEESSSGSLAIMTHGVTTVIPYHAICEMVSSI